MKPNAWAATLLGLLLATLTAACSESSREDLANSFKESYDASFRSSFRSSFVGTCAEQDETPENVALCTCMADDLLANFTPKELMNTDTMREHVQSKGLPKCEAQAMAGTEEEPDQEDQAGTTAPEEQG